MSRWAEGAFAGGGHGGRRGEARGGHDAVAAGAGPPPIEVESEGIDGPGSGPRVLGRGRGARHVRRGNRDTAVGRGSDRRTCGGGDQDECDGAGKVTAHAPETPNALPRFHRRPPHNEAPTGTRLI